MFNTLEGREKFVNNLKNDILQQFTNSNYQIWIFGSFLTDEYVYGESDIDIGIFCDDISELCDIYDWIDNHLNKENIEHDLVIVELDNDRYYMNIPIMLYGKPIMEYFTDKFIDNLKHLINIWGTDPFSTLLERNN